MCCFSGKKEYECNKDDFVAHSYHSLLVLKRMPVCVQSTLEYVAVSTPLLCNNSLITLQSFENQP